MKFANDEGLGKRTWAIAEGYIPKDDRRKDRSMISHETACILNTSDHQAQIEIMIFFSDREPAGPFRVTVEPRRTFHLRFNDLRDPEPVPRDTDYSSVIESDVPIVVQHTRLDTRNAEHALMTTIPFAA
ncbi:MAG: hypothetical protein A2428_10255 [Bdellovibrionales bacterium RIFOXYC1_FULL_54_43]|nr:MAG: hypothetical protein A2428_10255 [Bdellovibrionales bacterium RIFOXYC1_FULL_54_43]OFZ80546.1 MAG: hypothetical protein A2603_13000 [Bdellovibrionales bacterium RIFOXYD1_FULL_55_31]